MTYEIRKVRFNIHNRNLVMPIDQTFFEVMRWARNFTRNERTYTKG